jgi:hypothetical protein
VVASGFAVTAAWSCYVVNGNEEAKAIIEQAKKPSYQNALKILSEQPLDEQKKKAHIIAKFPERASLIVERKGPFHGGEKPDNFMRFKDKEKHKKGWKNKHRGGDEQPQSEEDSEEGDEL